MMNESLNTPGDTVPPPISFAEADALLYGEVGTPLTFRVKDRFAFPDITYKVVGIQPNGTIEVQSQDTKHSRTHIEILTPDAFQQRLDSHTSKTPPGSPDSVARLEQQITQLTADMEQLRQENARLSQQVKTLHQRLEDVLERKRKPHPEYTITQNTSAADLEKLEGAGFTCVFLQFEEGKLRAVHRRNHPVAIALPQAESNLESQEKSA